MASAEENVYSELIGFAGLQALVANADSPPTYRIYPTVMQHGSDLPALVYFRAVGDHEILLADGSGGTPERVLFQFTAWADSMKSAYDVAEQVRLALAAASFEVVVQINRSDYEPETRLFSFTYDIAVWHR